MCDGEVEISLPYDQGQQAIYSGAYLIQHSDKEAGLNQVW